MNKQISLRKAAILIVLAAVLVGSVAASIMYSRTVTNYATIKAAWGISLWRMDGSYVNPVELVTSIAWGELNPGTAQNTNSLFGTCLKLKNDGNAIVHVAWQLDPTTPLPTGVTLTARFSSGASYWDLPANDYATIVIEPGRFSGSPNEPNSGKIEFTLTIDQFAPPTSFVFGILLNAADSASG
jgi:hypothetical protein